MDHSRDFFVASRFLATIIPEPPRFSRLRNKASPTVYSTTETTHHTSLLITTYTLSTNIALYIGSIRRKRLQANIHRVTHTHAIAGSATYNRLLTYPSKRGKQHRQSWL